MKNLIYAILFLVIINIVLTATCKDGSICPENSTCFQVKNEFGCCPYENAIFCKDGIHCCPKDYTCDSTEGKCESGKNSFLSFVDISKSLYAEISSSIPYLEFFPEIKNLTNCAKDIYPIVKDFYNVYNEYRKGGEEGKENAKKLLTLISKDSVNMGIDCYDIVKTVLRKFEYIL